MYKYKLKGLMKGVDPDVAVQEIERIETVYGSITPEIIVNESERLDSVLHNCFTWDNDKAAHLYRMQQARIILNNIEVEIISGEGEKEYIAIYEIGSQGEYKNITTFDNDDVDSIKLTIKADIRYLQNKLRQYQRFGSIIERLGALIYEIDEL